jgi:hypothetical protein
MINRHDSTNADQIAAEHLAEVAKTRRAIAQTRKTYRNRTNRKDADE